MQTSEYTPTAEQRRRYARRVWAAEHLNARMVYDFHGHTHSPALVHDRPVREAQAARFELIDAGILEA